MTASEPRPQRQDEGLFHVHARALDTNASSAPPGQEQENRSSSHGLRCARLSPGCAAPVATFRGPVGAEGEMFWFVE